LEGGEKENLSIYPGLIVNYYKLICVNKINKDLKKELEKNLAKNKYAEIRNSLEQNLYHFNQIEFYFNDKIFEYIEKTKIKKNVFEEMANFYFSAENYAKFLEMSKRIDKKNDKLTYKIAVSNYKLLELNNTERLEEIRETLNNYLSKNKFSELYFHLFNINLLFY
jgi:virulence-associated protein VapD